MLGNPHYMANEGQRAAVVEAFRQELWKQLQRDTPQRREIERLARLHMAGEDINLICCCAPKSCHGDVVKRAILWMVEQLTK